MPRLSGKIAVITGAAKGSGKGIAKVFAREGASVALLVSFSLPKNWATSQGRHWSLMGDKPCLNLFRQWSSPKEASFVALRERFTASKEPLALR